MSCKEHNSSAAENVALSKGWRNHQLFMVLRADPHFDL